MQRLNKRGTKSLKGFNGKKTEEKSFSLSFLLMSLTDWQITGFLMTAMLDWMGGSEPPWNGFKVHHYQSCACGSQPRVWMKFNLIQQLKNQISAKNLNWAPSENAAEELMEEKLPLIIRRRIFYRRRRKYFSTNEVKPTGNQFTRTRQLEQRRLFCPPETRSKV